MNWRPEAQKNPDSLKGNALRILGLILESQAKRMPLTIRELMASTGIRKPNGVMCHLRRMKRYGLITSEVGHNRTLRPTCTVERINDQG